MNILNNNTFRIITAGLLGVIGTLVVQGLTNSEEVLVSDTTAETVHATGETNVDNIVNTVDNINNAGTNNLVDETNGVDVELDATTNSVADTEKTNNNQ